MKKIFGTNNSFYGFSNQMGTLKDEINKLNKLWIENIQTQAKIDTNK